MVDTGIPDVETFEAPGGIRAAAELSEGLRIVYPNQGVCRVRGIQAKEIAGQRLDFVAMTREEDGATIMVPVGKVPSIGLRKVADAGEVTEVFELLASSFDDPELDWKVRHRTHGDLLSAGGILGVTEVLKGLQALANLRPLPQKERERYDGARHLLVNEVTVALGVPPCTAEDYIDLALIPPPGTKRPPAKPRRAIPLPPRPALRRRRPGASEDELGLELEDVAALDLEAAVEPGVAAEEPAAGGEGEEAGEKAGAAEAGAQAEETPEEKAAKAAAPKKPKAPASERKKPAQAAAPMPAPAEAAPSTPPAAPAPTARPPTAPATEAQAARTPTPPSTPPATEAQAARYPTPAPTPEAETTPPRKAARREKPEAEAKAAKAPKPVRAAAPKPAKAPTALKAPAPKAPAKTAAPKAPSKAKPSKPEKPPKKPAGKGPTPPKGKK